MNNIDAVLNDLREVFSATEDMLNDWTSEGNLQFPTLMGMLAVKMNWEDKQLREIDPMVRYYVRRHPNWFVTRGAHGGIMRISDKIKKESEKKAKEAAKAKVKAAIDAKVKAQADAQAAQDNDSTTQESNS